MTSCATTTCGVGGWVGPLPGDPDNNSVLTATPAFGGIDVSWSYPVTNPEAVAYVQLYRGLLSNFDAAILIANVGGNFFYDKSTSTQLIQYYYWIKIVSVNGTVGALIGPASAIAKPTIADVIEGLTAKIDAGLLAQSLKTTIDQIPLNAQAIIQEATTRTSENSAFSQLLTQVQAGVANLYSTVQQEITTRQEGDSTLASAINTVQSVSGSNLASVQTALQTNITTVDGKVTAIGALYTAKVSVNGLIGGFGIYNDGTTVEAGFDVDTFWVGRTQANKRKPFIISGGVTYIDEAAIEKLTFSKLRDESGSFVVANGKVKANYLDVIQITGGVFTGYSWPAAGVLNTGFYLGPGGLLMGNYNNGKFIQITEQGDIIAPQFNIVDGVATFLGTVYANALNGDVNKIVTISGQYTGPVIGPDTWTTVGTGVLPASSHPDGHTPSAILTVFMARYGGGSGAVRLLVDGAEIGVTHSYLGDVATLVVVGSVSKRTSATTFVLQATGTSGYTVSVTQLRGYLMGVR